MAPRHNNIQQLMSSSRLRNLSKGENALDLRRDATPKSSKGSKLSHMFSNGKLAIREKSRPSESFISSKYRDDRPSSTKNS